MRSLLLERLYTVKGLTEARQFYDSAAYSPPFGREFHLKMLELEKSERKIDVKRARRVYEAATDQGPEKFCVNMGLKKVASDSIVIFCREAITRGIFKLLLKQKLFIQSYLSSRTIWTFGST